MTTFRMGGVVVPQNTVRIRQVSCLNCNVTLFGNFCHHCGQAGDTPAKVTFGQILRALPAAAFDFERALPHTILSLLIRPGRLVRDWLAGRRAKIYSPLALLFMLAGLVGVVSQALHLNGEGMSFSGAATPDARDIAIGDWMLANYTWVVVFAVPFQALGPTLVLRRRLGFDYGEQFMVTAMATAGMMALALVSTPLTWLAVRFHLSSLDAVGTEVMRAVYLAAVYAGIQKDGKQEWAITRWLRGFASVVASYVSMVLGMLVFVVVGLALVVAFKLAKHYLMARL